MTKLKGMMKKLKNEGYVEISEKFVRIATLGLIICLLMGVAIMAEIDKQRSEQKDNLVYVVTQNGFGESAYGVQLYLIGVYDTEEEANAVKEQYDDNIRKTKITPIPKGQTFPLSPIMDGENESNDYYLGGHYE
jgi:hypothetical protein